MGAADGSGRTASRTIRDHKTGPRTRRRLRQLGLVSVAGASSEPEIDEPPPNGITIASNRIAASSTAASSWRKWTSTPS